MQNIGIKLFDGTLYAVGDIFSMQGAEVIITTVADNQRIAEVELYLIDEKRPSGGAFIGKFTIRDIPEAKAGIPRFTLIIKADKGSNLDVSVYDKGKLSGKLDIPSSSWHPDLKSADSSHVITEKKDQTYKRDFEVSFKGQKDANIQDSQDVAAKTVLPTIPNEEKKHYLPKGEDTESKSPLAGILIASLVVVAIVTVLILAILRPWAGTTTAIVPVTSSDTSVVAPTESSENESGTDSSMRPEPTPLASEEPTPVEEIATPAPTIDPSVLIAAVNVKIRNIGLIYFEPDTTTIRADSFSKLGQLASVFSEYKGLIRVTLTGHTAQIGTQGEQTELSAQRAKLIADEMIERGAIDRDAIVWQGVGATMPATIDARRIELNRRVEIVVTMR